MKRVVIIAFLLSFSCNVFSQQENIWTFGIHAGLDFNGGTPVPLKLTASDTWEGTATIADENGELLFYTDGTTVYNKNHKIMPNGSNIQPYMGGGQTGTFSTSQAALIVPMPRKANQYYIFSLLSQDMMAFHPRDSAAIGKLFYSVVDMSLASGLGDVVASQKAIQIDSFLAEAMTSVKGEQCNVWVLVTTKDGFLKSYEITEDGIADKPVLSSIAGMNLGNPKYNAYGCMDVSPDGKHLAIAWQSTEPHKERFGRLGMYAFDPQSGLAGQERILDDTMPYYSPCFSPDGSKLYAAVSLINNDVYQYDLTAGSLGGIINSRQKIYTSKYKTWGTTLKRGPDGKIYYARSVAYPSVTTGYLSVINSPNLAGAAAQFVDTGIVLSYYTFSQRGLPNAVSIPESKELRTAGTKQQAVCWAPTATLAVEGQNNRDLLWSTGEGSSSIKVDSSGTYWVKYKKFCDTYVDTFHVSIFNPILKTANSCSNAANGRAWLEIQPDYTDGYQVIWRNDRHDTLSLSDSATQLPEGKYSLRILSKEGCDTTIDFQINSSDYPASFDMSDTLVCVGDEVEFRNTSDAYFTEINWDFGDGNTARSVSVRHRFEKPGQYQVRLLVRGELCSDTVHRSITVDGPIGNLSFEKEKDEICVGERIVFSTSMADSSLTGLTWQFGDGTRLRSFDNEVSHAYDSAGKKYVSLSAHSRACPVLSFIDSVSVYPLPSVFLDLDTGLCLNAAPIFLENTYPDHGGDRYQWSTGDTSRRLKVTHHGEYMLTVTNAFGCSGSDLVRIDKDCYLDVPNAFSPDGDGVNDYFFPRQLLGKGLTFFRMQVFNRWGQLVFESNNIGGRGWDGKFNGVDQPSAVYIYLIEVETANGQRFQMQGNVTLLR